MTARKHRKHGQGKYIGDFIFGIQDGLVETLGVTIGVAFGAQAISIVIIAGVAQTFAGAVSMAAGDYSSVKARQQLYHKELAQERKELQEDPVREKKEIERIYSAKGFKGKDLRKAVNIITSNKKRWLQVAMQEELGFSKIRKLNPFIGGFNSGVAYIIGAMFPLAPYLFFTLNTAIPLSIVLTAFGLFFVGAAKGAYTKVNWLKNGLEMLLVGGIAFIVGLIVGKMLSKI